jgi:hypothetical protein
MRSIAILFALVPLAAVSGEVDRGLTALRISRDGRAVEIQRFGDQKAYRVDVLGKCGIPGTGEPRIRSFLPLDREIGVMYGKHCYALVSLNNLSVSCKGCD